MFVPSRENRNQKKRETKPVKIALGTEVKKKKPNAAPVPVQEIRRDKTGHWPTFTEKRGRCKEPNCAGIPKVMCTKCKVHLCFTPSSNCFMEFHK